MSYNSPSLTQEWENRRWRDRKIDGKEKEQRTGEAQREHRTVVLSVCVEQWMTLYVREITDTHTHTKKENNKDTEETHSAVSDWCSICLDDASVPSHVNLHIKCCSPSRPPPSTARFSQSATFMLIAWMPARSPWHTQRTDARTHSIPETFFPHTYTRAWSRTITTSAHGSTL